MKRFVALLMALSLGACAPEPPPLNTPGSPGSMLPDNHVVRVIDVKVKEKTVTCVLWDGDSNASGMSCDWEHAK